MSWFRFFRRRRTDRDLATEITAHMNEERAENLAGSLRTGTSQTNPTSSTRTRTP